MQVTCRCEKSAVRASLSGELDHHGANEARRRLEEAIAPKQVRLLVVDMGGVTFMDSSGIGVVIGRYRTMCLRGGRMVLVNVPRAMEKLLKMSGLGALVQEE